MEGVLEAARYHVLADLFGAMEAATSIEGLAWLSAAAAREVLGAATATVSRYDAESGSVRTLVNVGQLGPGEQERPTDERYAVTDFPKLLQVAERQEPWSLHVGDIGEDPAELSLLRELDKTAALGCPVVLGSRVWGELYATRDGGAPFSARDRAVARMVAQAIALCIGRLTGHHELRELVYVDALTGLGNRRMLDETLERLAQHGEPTTVALWDLDGLKQVNDSHGHLAGDRLLREVALLLSAAAGLLPGSVATRLGGDEFCLGRPGPPAHGRRRGAARAGRSRQRPRRRGRGVVRRRRDRCPLLRAGREVVAAAGRRRAVPSQERRRPPAGARHRDAARDAARDPDRDPARHPARSHAGGPLRDAAHHPAGAPARRGGARRLRSAARARRCRVGRGAIPSATTP